MVIMASAIIHIVALKRHWESLRAHAPEKYLERRAWQFQDMLEKVKSELFSLEESNLALDPPANMGLSKEELEVAYAGISVEQQTETAATAKSIRRAFTLQHSEMDASRATLGC